MAFAYHRTYRAVLNTSLTTAMAFVGTGISPLMGFSTFGWFAAICIILNYVLVITFTPAALEAVMAMRKARDQKPVYELPEREAPKPTPEEEDEEEAAFTDGSGTGSGSEAGSDAE